MLLTSRREIAVRYGFGQISDAEHQDFVLHHISPSIVEHDTSIFLEHNIGLIAQERRLGAGWPGNKAIAGLVQRASGRFIQAGTASRFIQEGIRFCNQKT